MLSPITLEVVRNYLTAMLGEIETNLSRTAYSPIVYEVKDYCAALLDADANMISQAMGGLSVFLADLGSVVRDGLDIYGRDGFVPGDIVISNHAYTCGQHLNNVVLYSPIFVDGQPRPVAFVATRAHWLDIGGKATGSWATDTTEIYQEGLHLRTVKIFKAGKMDEEIARVLRYNSRFANQILGDMRAQVAACRLGERRFLELVGRYGLDTVMECVRVIWDQSEQLCRQQITAIPDGVYTAESFLDNDGVVLDRIMPIKVKVTIAGSDMTVDFTGVGEQVLGPFNCGYSGGVAAARVAFKYITSPFSPADEGAFRGLHIELPPGTFLSAQEPRAMGMWSTHLPTVIDTILKALSEALPDKIPAAHHGDLGGYFIGGYNPETGRRYLNGDSASGGWGARPFEDGPSVLKSAAHGDTYNLPVEQEEMYFPYICEKNELRQDSGGAGLYRGGLGCVRDYLIPHGAKVTVAFDRHGCPPWGLYGGQPGLTNGAIVQVAPDKEPFWVQKLTDYEVKPGGRLTVQRGGGGGWGDPLERPAERVREDVIDGYVSLVAAERDYGVVIRPDTMQVDAAGTAALRRARKSGK